MYIKWKSETEGFSKSITLPMLTSIHFSDKVSRNSVLSQTLFKWSSLIVHTSVLMWVRALLMKLWVFRIFSIWYGLTEKLITSGQIRSMLVRLLVRQSQSICLVHQIMNINDHLRSTVCKYLVGYEEYINKTFHFGAFSFQQIFM